MMFNIWNQMSRIQPVRLSILLGLSVSFAAALPVVVSGRWGLWQTIYLVLGWPLGSLVAPLRPFLPSAIFAPFFSGIDRISAMELLSGFFTWGLFFSSLIYGYLCRKKLTLRDAIHTREINAWPRSLEQGIRIAAIILLLLGGGIAALGGILNEYRASSGCGQEYSWPFDQFKAVGIGFSAGVPIFLIALFYWLFPVEKTGGTVTLLIAVVFAMVSGSILVGDTLEGYAPCDRHGDEHSEALLLLEMVHLYIWMLSYGISTLIQARLRRR